MSSHTSIITRRPVSIELTLVTTEPQRENYPSSRAAHKATLLFAALGMERFKLPKVRFLKYALRLASVLVICMGLVAQERSREEPIAYVGHGAMFDQNGREVAPTPSFIRQAQAWYRTELIAKLTKLQRMQFGEFERGLTQGLTLDEQSRLVLNTHLLDWLINAADVQNGARIRGKNNLIRTLLKRKLSNIPDVRVPRSTVTHNVNPELLKRLTAITASDKKGPGSSLETDTGGADYRMKCQMEGVPIPPDFGPGSAWKRHGQIPQENLFIVAGLRAEVFTYESLNPVGMCIALPRFDLNETIMLDGVICLGKEKSKACFWDNEKNAVPFQFQLGAFRSFSDFGGGTELVGDINIDGAGGVCSDCHSGQNPYIIHPNTILGDLKDVFGLPTFADARYDPIVRLGDTLKSGDPLLWPQNLRTTNPTDSCKGCHAKGGSGGVFPHLATDLPGYCGIFREAIGATYPGERNPPPTMPLGQEGKFACTPGLPTTAAGFVQCSQDVLTLLNLCTIPSTTNVAGRGDPHITTADGVNYDFQGAGEFVYLRDADGMEIQTRQKPIATTFNPGPNPHTGLASCVSVNTAVALRLGQHRVTFQPQTAVAAALESARLSTTSTNVQAPIPLELRIDGHLTTLSAQGIELGGGRIVKSVAGSGIEIYFPDGTHLIVTPNWWADQNTWYMNVDVLNTPSREGILGVVPPGSWLPSLPDATSLGPMPASLAQRHVDLNQRFADAWRVSNQTSLFDYSGGSSTATFTNRDWPPLPSATPQGGPCVIPGSNIPPAKGMDPLKAQELCKAIVDPNMNAECVFDLTYTGESGFADNYLLTQQLIGRYRLSRLVTISNAFSPRMMNAGGTSTVTVKLGNDSPSALTNASFTDMLDNMRAVGGAVGGSCVGTTPNALAAGATNLSFSGITIPAKGSCTVTFEVTSNSPGLQTNTVSGVTTTQAATSSASNPATLIVVALPITLDPASGALPAALVNTPYSRTFTATGGCASLFTYGLTSGALPPGLTLGADGVLSGTATQVGDFTFAVTATESCGSSQTQTYTLKVQTQPNIINTKTLVISAFRENGPNGAGDEFIEIFNPSSLPVTVSNLSGDSSGAIGVFSSAGNGTASNDVSLRCVIPGVTVIKGRGWYLCGGSQYSLSNLGGNGGTFHSVPDTTILGDIPNDAGLALLNIATDNVTTCQGGSCPTGFKSPALLSGNATVFDKVGFRPYGLGAPHPNTYPSLAPNYCEGTCLEPVGDASTVILTFACPPAVGPLSDPAAFPVQAGGALNGVPVCYGESGQYKIGRRRSAQQFSSSAGNLHRDTDNNADDFILDAPHPSTGNVGLAITGVSGVSSVLGAAGPHSSSAPPIVGGPIHTEGSFDMCAGAVIPCTFSALGPRNAERRYSPDAYGNPENDPSGTFILRRRFTNTLGATSGARYRIDDITTLCGGQSLNNRNSVVATQEARNLRGPDFTAPPSIMPIPTCQGEGADNGVFTAVLKALNHGQEIVVDSAGIARVVLGSVLEDTSTGAVGTPAVGRHQPFGGGSNSSFVATTATAPVGDGVNGGTGSFAAITGPQGTVFRIAFKFGVVKPGRFKLLLGSEVQ